MQGSNLNKPKEIASQEKGYSFLIQSPFTNDVLLTFSLPTPDYQKAFQAAFVRVSNFKDIPEKPTAYPGLKS